jgi:peptidoglycan/xylan/chitin deacetylase (PgdA/CDA1 family)
MALSGAGFLYRRSGAFRSGYRILTYHKVADKPADSYSVRTDHFREQMAFLSDHFKVTDLAWLAREVCSGGEPSDRAIAVTFDDGYRETATFVREILERYSIPATFFVVTGILDRGGQSPGGPYLTWDHARELLKAGFSIGSHTVTHRSLGQLHEHEIEEDLAVSRDRIIQELGVPPLGLSYPYGTLRDFSPFISEASRKAGYEYAVTAVHGLNHAGCDPFTLRRTSLSAGDGLRTFRMILRGNLDPWALVDRWGYRFQRAYDTEMGREGFLTGNSK